jgi:hypothetical protein
MGLLLVAFTASAGACVTQGVSGGPEQAGPDAPLRPGEAAWFSINGVEPGADVTVSVGGTRIFEKVIEPSDLSSSGELRRTFTVPELGGGARDVQFAAGIDHQEASEGVRSGWVRYDPTPASAPVDEAAPVPEAAPATPPVAPAIDVERPATSTPPSRHRSTSPAAAHVRMHRPAPPARPAISATAAADAPATPAVQPTPGASARTRHRAAARRSVAPRPAQVPVQRVTGPPAAQPDAAVATRAVVRPHVRARSVPWMVLAGALVVALMIGAAGAAVMRRREDPPPDLSAELAALEAEIYTYLAAHEPEREPADFSASGSRREPLPSAVPRTPRSG